MSSLFTRLALHAAGQPRNPVRPMVKPAYQPGPEPFPTQPGFPDSIPAADVAEKYPRTQHDVPPPQSRASRLASSTDAKAEVGASTDKAQVRPAGSGAEIIETERALVPGLSGSVGESVSHRPLPATAAANNEFASSSTNDFPLSGESTHPEEAVLYESPQTGPRAPELLLPSVAGTAAANTVTVPLTSPAAPEPPNEVHVHIGRIEVTALQQDAAPKQKKHAARQPMSLDDYLARLR